LLIFSKQSSKDIVNKKRCFSNQTKLVEVDDPFSCSNGDITVHVTSNDGYTVLSKQAYNLKLTLISKVLGIGNISTLISNQNQSLNKVMTCRSTDGSLICYVANKFSCDTTRLNNFYKRYMYK